MAEEFKPCSIDGCNKQAKQKGWCWGHYCRWRLHGDPLSGRIADGVGLAFCQDAATHEGEVNCLFWPYGKDGNGYGMISLVGKVSRAHRYVCQLAHGDAPFTGAVAAHSCGNGHLGCVNPNHLRWATESENAQDKMMHGTHICGSDHILAILNDRSAMEIFKAKGSIPQHVLANRFGVTRTTISKIQRKGSWKHIHE